MNVYTLQRQIIATRNYTRFRIMLNKLILLWWNKREKTKSEDWRKNEFRSDEINKNISWTGNPQSPTEKEHKLKAEGLTSNR